MLKRFVLRHWKGELSLPFSYWVIGTALGTVLVFSAGFLVQLLDSFTPSITFTAWSTLLMYPALWVLLLWIYVGIWNSATNYMAAGKSKVWGNLAKLGVVFGLLQVTTQVIKVHLPVMGKMTDFVTGSDPAGTVKYEVLDDGRTLYITGVFGNGSSSTVLDALNKNPSVKRLHLSSPGGRLKEVIRLSKEIQTRKLETYVEAQCLSFCTVIFLSGSTRYSTPNAQIGFHSPTFTGRDEIDSTMIEESRNLYRTFNLPENFIRKIFSTPHSEMWYPSHRELIDAGVITDQTFGGESNLLQKSLNLGSVEEVKRALLSIPLWQGYERKFPGVVDEVSTKIFNSIRNEETDADAMTTSRKYLASYTMRAIAESNPQIRARYLSLLVDQTRYVATLGPKFCAALLASKLDITKSLPKNLVDRELTITQEALDSDFIPPLNYSNANFEKYLVSALTKMNDSEIQAISNPSSKPTQETCSGLVKFYEGIAAMPPSQIDLVFYGLIKQ